MTCEKLQAPEKSQIPNIKSGGCESKLDLGRLELGFLGFSGHFHGKSRLPNPQFPGQFPDHKQDFCAF
jgi:hypothetical protein